MEYGYCGKIEEVFLVEYKWYIIKYIWKSKNLRSDMILVKWREGGVMFLGEGIECEI